MHATGQEANDLIRSLLQSENPCMIARFGKTEIEAVMAARYQNRFIFPWTRLYQIISLDVPYKGWKRIATKLCNLSGVFPADEDTLHKFADTYVSTMPAIDIIGSWLHAERLLADIMPSVKRVPLGDIAPFFVENPWTQVLAGKRVLVIHPFESSIKKQYSKRHFVFADSNVLPDFDLITLRAAQTLGGRRDLPFCSWFDALASMKEKIDDTKFDIAIIGAGAYGLPLAAHVKSIGKKAVHLGGSSQLLFGIYGKRWEDNPRIKSLINEHWIRPLDADRIDGLEKIENGCYW